MKLESHQIKIICGVAGKMAALAQALISQDLLKAFEHIHDGPMPSQYFKNPGKETKEQAVRFLLAAHRHCIELLEKGGAT